jgi:hypothetical protein
MDGRKLKQALFGVLAGRERVNGEGEEGECGQSTLRTCIKIK